MRGVAEGFGTSGAGSGEGSGEIANGKAGGQVGAAHELVQKAGIEAVAGAHRVLNLDLMSWADDAFGSALRQSSFAAEFYHHQRNSFRKHADRRFQVLGPGNFANLTLIGQKDVNVVEDFLQSSLPAVIGNVKPFDLIV